MSDRVRWTMPMLTDLKNLSESEVMRKHNLREGQVMSAMYRYGVAIKTRSNTSWTNRMVLDLRKMSNKEFSDKYPVVSIDAIKKARTTHKAIAPKQFRHKRYHAEDVARMFTMRTDGFSWADIGATFGVCRNTVYEVYRRALVNGFDSYPLRGTKNDYSRQEKGGRMLELLNSPKPVL